MENFLESTLRANQEIYSEINNNFKEEWIEYLDITSAGGDFSCKPRYLCRKYLY